MESDHYMRYQNMLGWKHQLIRLLWSITWGMLARPLPRSLCSGWKRLLLQLFGAKIDKTAVVYSSAKVFFPANLVMQEYSCLDSNVNCYNVAPISIGSHATVSQGAFLCTASHDISNPKRPLVTAPIIIESQAWIAAEAFIGMGTVIGEGAVIGARAVVFKDVPPWTVVVGNPAMKIKERHINTNNNDGE